MRENISNSECAEDRPVVNATKGSRRINRAGVVLVLGAVGILVASACDRGAPAQTNKVEPGAQPSPVTAEAPKYSQADLDKTVDAAVKKALDAQTVAPAKAVATATATVAPTEVAKSTGTMPAFVENVSRGAWKIEGTDRLNQNPIVKSWLQRIRDVAPQLWKRFPNIPNPDVPEFRVVNGKQVPDGMEYGTYSTPFMWKGPGDIPVGAWEYRLITGDYNFLGTECKGDGQKGCMLVLENVMDQSFTFRDQYVDNGFTLRGRYWNGDTLDMGTWGLISHAAANMLNMPTLAREGEVLNSGDPGNSGANCGTPAGCPSVDVRLIVHAGDAIIAQARTVVTKNGATAPTN